jgi:hypothetical protein
MSRSRKLFSVALFLLAASANDPSRAEQDPAAPPPDVGTVLVSKVTATGSVRVTWTTGAAPFAVVRSESPNFSATTTWTFLSRSASSPTDDVGVLNDTKTYYYQVPDGNAQPFILAVAGPTSSITADDILTIDGWGLSSATEVDFGGDPATPIATTSTQLTVQYPDGASTGAVGVNSTTSSPAKIMRGALRRSFTEPWHLAHDALGTLYVADRTGGALWKRDPTTLAWSNLISLATCVGLPVDGSNNIYAVDGTSDPANKGVIKQISSSGSINANWGTAMLPVNSCYPRALAAPRLVDGSLDPAPASLLMEDAANGCVRPITSGSTGGSCAYTTGTLGGFPAGLVWLRTGNLLYTRGNTIFEITSAGAAVASYNTLSGVTLSGPSQLAVDRYGDVWGTDRLGNFVFKLRTDPTDRRMRKVFNTPMDDVPVAPRGIALDESLTPAWQSYVDISDGTGVFRYHRRDRVHLKLRVLDTALHGASTVLLNEPDIAYIQALHELEAAVAHWTTTYTKAGIEFVIDDAAQITEPLPRGDFGVVAGAGQCNGPSTASTQELAILNTRTASEPVIYIYYIHHYVDHLTGALMSLAGRTYTTDTFTNSPPDLTGSGIFVARFGMTLGGSGLDVREHGEQIGHEIGHFLLEYGQIMDGNSCSHEHTSTAGGNADRIMFPTVGFRTKFTDDERNNIWTLTNPYNPWIEHF